MSKDKQNAALAAALAETFALMQGDEFCEIHKTKCVAKSDGFGNTFYHCPACLAASEKADADRIRKMNADIAFADFHARTDA